MQRFTIALALCAATLTACGGGSSSPTPTSPAPIPAADACNVIGGGASTSGLPILNGSTCDPERSSIVLLNMRHASGSVLGGCSGTIVTPRVVLTAAHCLDEEAAIVRVWLGPPNQEIVAQSFTFYPGYVFNTSSTFDVGVVVMAEPLPRRPLPVLTSRDARVGETAVLVGWGRDQADVGATLRAGSTTISSVSARFLETLFAPPSSSICSGDSGGPILVQQDDAWAIAGISSATSANACNTGTNFYQAVRHPSVLDFIRQQVQGFAER